MRGPALVMALMLGTVAVAAPAPEILSHGIFDRIALYRPPGEASSVALLFSGDGGWEDGLDSLAKALSGKGALVAGIRTPALFKKLENLPDSCVFPDGDLENLSHFIQGYAQLPTYRTPLLAGYSSGASLAYTMLAQTPPGIFAGALTLGFCRELELRKPLCRGEGVHFKKRADLLDLLPAKQLHAPWVDVQGEADSVCPLTPASGFVKQTGGAAMAVLPSMEHGLEEEEGWQPAMLAAYSRLAALSTATQPPPPGSLADLPVIEIPATAGGDSGNTFAVLLSGDGGWAGLDKQVAAALAARGIPVVGFDSLRYFWKKRTPETLAQDLDQLLRYYAAQWKKSRVLLLGYSQGADVLPFAVNRLPAASRAMLVRTVLMGLGEKASFEFHLTNWVGGSRDALPILPEAQKLKAREVLCLYGSDDRESLCPKIPPGHVTAEPLPGGHHFDGAYGELAARIMAGLPD
ncbi:MAG: AcvB/VirJ family lysyl-phosphatidylglycerol hydrolase [Steroidobacteraceae bacterium]